MTPAARLQAAIEVLDEVIASAREDGPPADSIVTRYFKHRRYAGSKDRRAVRELVFRPSGGRQSGRRADAPQSSDWRRTTRTCSTSSANRADLSLWSKARGPPEPVWCRRGSFRSFLRSSAKPNGRHC